MPKAYSYLRFSTPEQIKGDSFRRQTEMARRYALENGLDLIEGDYSDLGISAFRGKNADKGALADFLDTVKAGVIPKGSYLLVENLDRISRTIPRKAVRILEDICEQGVTVVTLSDNQAYDEKRLDKDPTVMMMSLFHFIRAHSESEMKSKRGAAVWDGKRQKAKEKPLTAKAPAWLALDRNTGTFTLIPERGEVVKEIFDLYLSGIGPGLIAITFNKRGLPVWGRGDYWYKSYISKILDNAAVIGTMTPHKVEHNGHSKKRIPLNSIENYFPAAIDAELFDRVQELRKTGTIPGKAELRNVFSGLAVCPHCGASMIRVNKSKGKASWVYLVCSKAKSGAGCEYHGVKYYDLEESFLPAFQDNLPGVPTADHHIDALREEIGFKKGKLAKHQRQLSNIMEAIKSGQISYETSLGTPENEQLAKIIEEAGLLLPKTVTEEIINLERVIENYKRTIVKLLEQYEAAQPKMIEIKIQEAIHAVEERADTKRINAALRSLCQKIVINYPDSRLMVHFKHTTTILSLPLLSSAPK